MLLDDKQPYRSFTFRQSNLVSPTRWPMFSDSPSGVSDMRSAFFFRYFFFTVIVFIDLLLLKYVDP